MKFWKFIAMAMIALGFLRAAMGFWVASFDDYEAAAMRYLGSASSGDAIDQGLILLVIGLFARFVLKRLSSKS